MIHLEKGKLYFVNDDFFTLINDKYLKMNKEQTDRPHYYAFADETTDLLWMIPCSSQIEKYAGIIKSKEEKHRPSNHIQIIKVSGKKQALLFQDMFPILPEYIKGAYMNAYGDFQVTDPKLIDQIESNARKIIKLLRHGIRFTPTQPDIFRIEQIMLRIREQKTLDC